MAIYQQIKCIQILTRYFESLIDLKVTDQRSNSVEKLGNFLFFLYIFKYVNLILLYSFINLYAHP